MLQIVERYAELERARIWSETNRKAAEERERLAKNGLISSSSNVRIMADLGVKSIQEHGVATWKVLLEILESSPRNYYRAYEVDEIRQFVQERFSSDSPRELSLVHTAHGREDVKSGFYTDAMESVKKAQVAAREKLEAEVDKYFCTRRSLVRWLVEVTQHPLMTHFIIFLAGLFAAYVLQKWVVANF